MLNIFYINNLYKNNLLIFLYIKLICQNLKRVSQNNPSSNDSSRPRRGHKA